MPRSVFTMICSQCLTCLASSLAGKASQDGFYQYTVTKPCTPMKRSHSPWVWEYPEPLTPPPAISIHGHVCFKWFASRHCLPPRGGFAMKFHEWYSLDINLHKFFSRFSMILLSSRGTQQSDGTWTKSPGDYCSSSALTPPLSFGHVRVQNSNESQNSTLLRWTKSQKPDIVSSSLSFYTKHSKRQLVYLSAKTLSITENCLY